MRTYRIVKICGITREEDAIVAINAGADFIGMVMHEKSPRYCSVQMVQKISKLIPFRPRVLVFGKDPVEYTIELYHRLNDPFLFIQYPFGTEGFADVVKETGNARMIPSFAVTPDFIPDELNELSGFNLVVLDTGGIKGQNGDVLDGGTGKVFNWDLIKMVSRPYLLAGGLNPDNVSDAVVALDPLGFDVSGGVEKSNGIKNAELVKQFIINARQGEKTRK